MINRLKKSKAGFTLIELMVVVGIISVLSAIAIPNFLAYRTKGLSAVAKSEANIFYTTALAYFADTAGSAAVDRTNCPGFGMNSDIVTNAGGSDQIITYEASTGMIDLFNPTFVHKDGGITYTLNSNGTITGS